MLSSSNMTRVRRLSITWWVGMVRFNTICSGLETLLLSAEIEDPQRWIDRVL